MGEKKFFRFTESVLERAKQLHKSRRKDGTRMDWNAVAKELGCDPNSLQATLARQKKEKGGQSTTQKERERLQELVVESQGKIRVKALAREFGVSLPAMSARLTRIGLDKRRRKELSQV